MSGSVAIVPPRQARTRASWDRVLDEGVALLESGGYGALTIGALCARAGVTPPTIYARAGNKEQLLLAVYERAMQRITGDDALDPGHERWAAMTAAEVVREAVGQVAHIWLIHAALLRAIVHRSAVDDEVRRRGSLRSRELAARFRAVLLTRRDALPATPTPTPRSQPTSASGSSTPRSCSASCSAPTSSPSSRWTTRRSSRRSAMSLCDTYVSERSRHEQGPSGRHRRGARRHGGRARRSPGRVRRRHL